MRFLHFLGFLGIIPSSVLSLPSVPSPASKHLVTPATTSYTDPSCDIACRKEFCSAVSKFLESVSCGPHVPCITLSIQFEIIEKCYSWTPSPPVSETYNRGEVLSKPGSIAASAGSSGGDKTIRFVTKDGERIEVSGENVEAEFNLHYSTAEAGTAAGSEEAETREGVPSPLSKPERTWVGAYPWILGEEEHGGEESAKRRCIQSTFCRLSGIGWLAVFGAIVLSALWRLRPGTKRGRRRSPDDRGKVYLSSFRAVSKEIGRDI
ncbi:hypothetical protein RUND412_006559 [Rhizina undulata]